MPGKNESAEAPIRGAPARRLRLALRGALLTAITIALLLAPARARSDDSETESTPPPPPPAGVLELTERERTILGAVRDRDAQLDEPAFYMLLDKCVEVATTDHPSGDQLDAPSFRNLVDYPERYRGWAVRANLQILLAEELTAPHDLTPPARWSPNRTVWKLSCYPPRGNSYSGTPVIVFTPIKPAALGKPRKTTEEGEHQYPGTKQYRAEGFFYKVCKYEARNGRERYYPVILAWGIDSIDEKPSETEDGSKTMRTLLLFIVGLLIIYIFTRRHIRRQSETAEQYRYRPLREELEGDESLSPGAKGKTPGEIDPRLIEATEEYRKKEEPEDGADSHR